nr:MULTISPECIES: hypothetical protein [unclassified Providencia]
MSSMIIAPQKDQISTQGGPCWVPPEFPLDGRLKLTKEQLIKNIEKNKTRRISTSEWLLSEIKKFVL